MMSGLLPELFVAQAARTPEAPAVLDGDRSVSYAELDAASGRLAARLLAEGAGPESLVAVCLPRGVDLVVTLLAVWRAGAAYVPLDRAHPDERLRWILADTGARLLVADAATGERLASTGVTTIAPSAALSGEPAPVALDPAHAAYVIYTSGSTGRPKGVLVSHGAIANRVLWTVRRHQLGAGDRVLQKTTLTFDAAAWEIFAPLVSGGAVALAPDGAERDAAALLAALGRHQATVLQVVPSQLRLLVDEPGWTDCDQLRLVFSAGEALRAELCQQLWKNTGADVWNTYGPTECAIDVTAFQADRDQATGAVSIGRPIDNLRVLVLDESGELAPMGVAGELHVGGAGLARGYVGRPGLTAERFVPDPYGVPGARLYRTGDAVRWSDDGTLEYLGRLDQQVKVNGVRVEPGEVESALHAHPGLRGAVVVAAPGPDGTDRLVGYVVFRDDEIAFEQLRLFLRDKLPEPLIPSVFVALSELPLTHSGKVNRTLLPDPFPTGGSSKEDPRTPSEHTVAEVWSALLGVEQVGVNDDFFQLGGSSLLLTRLASRLAAATGREVSVPDLFSHTTVADQARLIEEPGVAQSAPPLQPMARDGRLPLSYQQSQMWMLDQIEPGNIEWVTPMVVRLPASLDSETIRSALGLLAERHEILRTRYASTGGVPHQIVDAEPGPVPLRVVDAGPDDDWQGLAGEEFARAFDLAQGPVWRAVLVRRLGEDHTLLAAIHHIASDGWSSVVFAEDVRALCAAAELDPLPVQYADYAAWQRARLTDEALEPLLRYWRTALAGMSTLDLPADRARPQVRDSRGAVVRFAVPEDLAARLVELGREHGATPSVTFLTAFATLVAHGSGQWDVPVGAPVAGRTRPEVAGLIGPFLNMLVLRCRLSAGLSFQDALRSVASTCRGAFAHQDLPFERLVDDLAPPRDLSRTPLYQVMFNFLTEGETMGDDNLDAFQNIWRVAKTDLTLFLYQETGGGMTGVLEYATSLFQEQTIARLAERFLKLLERLADDPATTLAAAGDAAQAPRGVVEERMAEIWTERLGHPVGVDQNFFASGGNSMLALRLMADVQDEFDLDLPVRLIFERPTVAGLSSAVVAQIRADLARPSAEELEK